MPEYFLILLALLFITFVLHRLFAVKLFKSPKHLVLTYLVGVVVGSAWDQFAIWRGHWSFGPKYLLVIKLGFMPVEEFLFIIVVAYFFPVVYKVWEKKFKG